MIPTAELELANYAIDDLFPPSRQAADGERSDGVDNLARGLAEAADLIQRGTIALSRLWGQVRPGRVLETFRFDPLVEAIDALAQRNPHALMAVTRKPGQPAASRPVAIATLMTCFANKLGLPWRERREAMLTGILHDIGMLFVPGTVLDKTVPLRVDELAELRDHVVRGEAYLAACLGLPAAVLAACRQHHERMDGTGYPDRLAAQEITTLARMLAICDSYHAMVSPRAQRGAMLPTRACREIQRDDGLDAQLVDAFVNCAGLYPLGSLVQLVSGKLGVVTGFRAGSVERPIVSVFQSAISGRRIEPAHLDCSLLANERTVETIATIEDPARWRFEGWDERWPAIVATGHTTTSAPKAAT